MAMNFPASASPEPEAHAPSAARPRIFVVDDDDLVRTAIARLLGLRDYAVSAFQCAESFLLTELGPDIHGCIVLDVAMPGLDGLALQQALAERGCLMPVIFLTGHGDVPMCARAMKRGAFDFLTKPVDDSVLFATVERALEKDEAQWKARALRALTEARLSTLTAREREVLTHVMAGRLNKQIAADLGTAEKTIKVHRARGMEKMHVRSVAELVRIVERARLSTADATN
ncbi:MAG TPA: response regulator [Burkholderiaceae bacterium]|nr:response regulator [Burkholderiaceae bacterium]